MATDKVMRPPIELIDLFKSGAGQWFLTLWSYLQGLSGGYTNLTQFVAQTGYRMFYSDNLGDVKELAHGANNTFLKSGGATSNPSWSALTMSHFTNQTGYRTFYSDSAGAVKELTHGTSGKYLRSNGPSADPSWETYSGSVGDRPKAQLTFGIGGGTNIGGAASGSYAPIAWNSQTRLDTATFTHSTTTNNSRLTVDVTGRYHVQFSIVASHTTTETKDILLCFRVNGSTINLFGSSIAQQHSNATHPNVWGCGSTEIDLTANDYVEVVFKVLTASGSGATTTAAGYCEFLVTRIE